MPPLHLGKLQTDAHNFSPVIRNFSRKTPLRGREQHGSETAAGLPQTDRLPNIQTLHFLLVLGGK